MAERYICNECGELFEHPKIIKESRGECFGFPAFEDVAVCPYCRGDFREADEEETEEEEEC